MLRACVRPKNGKKKQRMLTKVFVRVTRVLWVKNDISRFCEGADAIILKFICEYRSSVGVISVIL